MVPPSSLVVPQGWGLIDLPLRASNEGSPRPRVARAQKIIRLHPFLCSALSFPAALVYPLKGGLVDPLLRASNEAPSCILSGMGAAFSARVQRGLRGRALREHRRSSGSIPSHCWIAESNHFPSGDRMKVQASPDSVGVFSLPSMT